MPIFEIQDKDGGVYEVEAPDQESAVRAFRGYTTQQAQQQTPQQQAPQQQAPQQQAPQQQAPQQPQQESGRIYAREPDLADRAGDLVRALGLPNSVAHRTTDGVSAMGAAFRGLANPLGWGDEIAAAGGALTGIDGEFGDYAGNLARQRQITETTKALNPIAYGAGNLAGDALPAAAAAKMGLTLMGKGGSALKSIAAGVGEGAVYGGIAGAGHADPGKRMEGAAWGAGTGAAVGGGLSALSRAGRQWAANRRFTKDIPTTQDLRQAKKAAYQHVDDLGARYKPAALADLADAIDEGLKAKRFRKNVNRKVHRVVKVLRKDLTGKKSVSLSGLDDLRQYVSRNITDKPGQHKHGYYGDIIKKNMDEFIDSAGPQQMTMGDAPRAAQAMKAARASNRRYKKMQAVDDAIEKVKNNPNSTTPYIAPFRQLIQSPRLKGRFDPPERAIIEQIVRGTPKQKALDKVGWWGGKLGSSLSAGVGAAVGGVPGAVAAPAAGFLARGASGKISKGQVELLQALIANQGRTPKPKPDSEIMRALQRALAGHSGGRVGKWATTSSF